MKDKMIFLIFTIVTFFSLTSVVYASEEKQKDSYIQIDNNEEETTDPYEGAITFNNPTEEELLQGLSESNPDKIILNIDYASTLEFSGELAQEIKEKDIEVFYNLDYSYGTDPDVMSGPELYITEVYGRFNGSELTDVQGLNFYLAMDMDFSNISNYTDYQNSYVMRLTDHSVYGIPSAFCVRFRNTISGLRKQSIDTLTFLTYDEELGTWSGRSRVGDNSEDCDTWDSYWNTNEGLVSNSQYILHLDYIAEWQKADGVWRYYDKKGQMVKGWLKDKGKWYYLKDSGAMATGWMKVKGKWYYLKASGAMVTGWREIKGKWYYLKASGAMATGWTKVKGKWYYLKASGAMASNTWIGKYYVNKSGVWTRTK